MKLVLICETINCEQKLQRQSRHDNASNAILINYEQKGSKYCISANSFCGNYSFKHKSVETIQGRKLFKSGNSIRKYGTYGHCRSLKERPE